MRYLTRFGLALCTTALAVPSAAWAGDAPGSTASSRVTPPKHKAHWGHTPRLCAKCQAAKLRAQGINVPPPPPFPNGVVVEEGGMFQRGNTSTCATCPPALNSTAATMASQGASAPGYAVVGNEYQSAEPAPVGVVQANYATAAPMNVGRAMATDRPAQAVGVAPTPLGAPKHERAHIVAHLFGYTPMGRAHREAREQRARDAHASIPYGDPLNQQITDLPSSVVYRGR